MQNVKRIILLLVLVLLSCTLEASSKPVEEVQPDTNQRFKISQSLISSHPDSRDTTLWVILCTDDLSDLDTIFEEIKMFTEHMNGESNCLTIHLFRSKIDLENNVKFGSKTYIKGELGYEKN